MVSPLVHELTYQVCCSVRYICCSCVISYVLVFSISGSRVVMISFSHSRPWCMIFWVSKRMFTRKMNYAQSTSFKLLMNYSFTTSNSYQTATEGGAVRSRDIILDGQSSYPVKQD